jgi:hypothetical protein
MMVALGAVVVAASSILYSWEEQFMDYITPSLASLYETVAELYLVSLVLGVSLALTGVFLLVFGKLRETRQAGYAPVTPSGLIPYVLSQKKYRRVFAITALAYGAFYALVTSIVVYQPGVDFVQAYGATLPSAEIVPCCGDPLQSPVVVVYLANHLGLLLVPLTLLLWLTVSSLVGLNAMLAAFALSGSAEGVGRGWLGGVGAAIGLFTGCPTCAGLFFANFLGGAGAVYLATALSYYQLFFIALSVPVLLATPFLISRSLSKVYRDGCIYFAK